MARGGTWVAGREPISLSLWLLRLPLLLLLSCRHATACFLTFLALVHPCLNSCQQCCLMLGTACCHACGVPEAYPTSYTPGCTLTCLPL
jgi:hypothetical protein